MRACVSVILAAGKGKRMNAGGTIGQKVLARIRNKPMVGYVLDAVVAAGIRKAVVIVGHQSGPVREYLRRRSKELAIDVVEQRNPLGTADAVKQALPHLNDRGGDILVLYGDTPLLTRKTLGRLLEAHQCQENACTLLTTLVQDPTGYGRIVRNGTGSVARVTEELDATAEERKIKEINVGAYCFKAEALMESLPEVKPSNRKNEYYLTDTIAVLSGRHETVHSVLTEDQTEVLGVNSPEDLKKARLALSQRTTKS